MKTKIIFILSLFLIFPLSLFAYEASFIFKRDVAIQNALNAAERDYTAEKALRNITIELTLEYGFAAKGEQSFDLMDSEGGLASKLIFPFEGKITVAKGEIGFGSKFFLGGKFGSSNFKKRTCSDEDWNIYDPTWSEGTDEFIDYQITKQMEKVKTEFFNVNFYYRLFDLNKEDLKQKHLFLIEDVATNSLLIDRLAFDIFVGYQYQKNHCRLIDPMMEYILLDEGSQYYVTGLPDNIGLDSFYKTEYKGPRLGLRAIGSKDKLTAKISLAYAYLETKAIGWWNLRDLSFWQKGGKGSGLDVELEAAYALTPHLSLGVGFDLMYRRQNKLKLHAIEAGLPWWDGYRNRVKNADSILYYPSVFLKLIW